MHLCHKLVLAGWFAGMVALSGTLLVRHLAPLPHPSRDDAQLATTLTALRGPGDGGRLLAVHVLYATCRCSRRIAEHLLDAARPAGVAERVVLVGDDPDLASRLTARGFLVVPASETELATRFHIAAAPLFVVLSPDGKILYAGGYTAQKQGSDPRDLDILARARANEPLEQVPVFGCAVAEDLKRRLDPTGVL